MFLDCNNNEQRQYLNIWGHVRLAMSYRKIILRPFLILSKDTYLLVRVANFNQCIYNYYYTANWYLFHWVLYGT